MNFSKLKVSKNIKPHVRTHTHTHTQISKHTRWQHELEPAETHKKIAKTCPHRKLLNYLEYRCLKK